MALFFDGISALDCYRAMNLAGASVGAPKRYAREFAASVPDVASLGGARQSFPKLDSPRLLVSESSKRCRIRGVACRVLGSPLPNEAFVFLGGDAYACSPAFAFVRSAVELDFAEQVLLGYEITGTYRLNSSSEQGFFSAPPLASCQALTAITSQGNLLGANKAENALRFVSPGSASPMETALAMLLSMPKAKGGYGLPLPQLNAAVEVPKGDWRVAYGRQFRCDLLWPTADLCVEYDSDMFHTGSQRIAHDARRRNALASLGFTVITATKSQVTSVPGLDQLASQVAKGIGVRLRMERVNRKAQRALLDCVLGGSRSPRQASRISR